MYVSKPFGGGRGGGGGAKGDKIRIGCLTPAFWGAHKWEEMLRHPCILDDPQQRGQNQSTKKTNKNKHFPMVSMTQPRVAVDPQWGLNT